MRPANLKYLLPVFLSIGCGDGPATPGLPPDTARGANLLLPWRDLSGHIALVFDAGIPQQVARQIVIVDAIRREVRTIRTTADEYAGPLEFSPDGSKLSALMTPRDGGPSRTDIMDVRDGRILESRTAACFSWLPDGRISYMHNDSLYVAGHSMMLLKGACPSWTADGTSFVTLLAEPTGYPKYPYQTAVYRVVLTDPTPRRIVGWAAQSSWEAQWGAALLAGETLALTRVSGTSPYDHIWLVNADGSSPRQLTKTSDESRYPVRLYGNIAWAPNGTRIVGGAYLNGPAPGAFVFSATDGSFQQLSSAPTYAVAWGR